MSTLIDTDTAGSSAPDTTTQASAEPSSQGQQAVQQQQQPQDAAVDPFWKDWLSSDGKLNKASYDRLPEDMKGFRATLEKHDTIESFLRAASHANTLIGKKGLMPLEENAPEAARKEFDSRLREVLRVPEKADGYGFKRPDNFDEKLYDGDYATQVSEILHKHAASPGLAKDLFEHNMKYMGSKAGEITAANERAQAESEAAQRKSLEQEWGSNFEANAESVVKYANRLGVDLQNPAIGKNAEALKLILKVGDLIGEDKLKTSGSSGYAKSGAEQMADFRAGELWKAAGNPMDPRHAQARREFERISVQMAKEKEQE